MTLLSSLVVALTVLFVLDAVPVFTSTVGTERGSSAVAARVGHGVFVVGYLCLAVGVVASAVATAHSRALHRSVAPTAVGVVLVGVALVGVGAGTLLVTLATGTASLATFAFLSVGVPPALLVVAYDVAVLRNPRNPDYDHDPGPATPRDAA